MVELRRKTLCEHYKVIKEGGYTNPDYKEVVVGPQPELKNGFAISISLNKTLFEKKAPTWQGWMDCGREIVAVVS